MGGNLHAWFESEAKTTGKTKDGTTTHRSLHNIALSIPNGMSTIGHCFGYWESGSRTLPPYLYMIPIKYFTSGKDHPVYRERDLERIVGQCIKYFVQGWGRQFQSHLTVYYKCKHNPFMREIFKKLPVDVQIEIESDYLFWLLTSTVATQALIDDALTLFQPGSLERVKVKYDTWILAGSSSPQ